MNKQKEDDEYEITKEDLKLTKKKIMLRLKSGMWWFDNLTLIALITLIIALAMSGYFTDTEIIRIPVETANCALTP